MDFGELLAPGARMESIRTLLAVHHMDVKSTFLNGVLLEVYVKQPPGFVSKESAGKVFKLNKALYGLKQALELGMPS